MDGFVLSMGHRRILHLKTLENKIYEVKLIIKWRPRTDCKSVGRPVARWSDQMLGVTVRTLMRLARDRV